ncbi:polyhydroxyalkanoic acid system family protein [Pseudahrensia aquimaris]|uniref:Polyhydroxyalkanoic acid system family protein n=1 Tax=Pseudahrensia aquimaris TaxID=744461 RepID=A0ABW3FLE7_9HYPH
MPHKLTKEGAHEKIDKGFAKVQEQIGGKGVAVEQSWDGDIMSFTAGAMGQKLSGRLTVMDDKVHIEVDLPWLLAKLSGTVKEKLAQGTKLLLEKK